MIRTYYLLLLAMVYSSSKLMGQTDPEPTEVRMPNIPFPTMGGSQFWTDHRWWHGWRLQQNVMTGHWRVIDSKNVRYAWGNEVAARKDFDKLSGKKEIAAADRVLVLVHGLFRSSNSMEALGEYLRRQDLGEPVLFEYASSRGSITEHAGALREVVEGLPGKPKIAFVAHSMGNIVCRHVIGDWQRDDPTEVIKRLDRMVMLGPPNQGAAIARQLSKLQLFQWTAGQGGMELGPVWDSFQANLATPPCPFAIVAGNLEDSYLQNPLIEGPSDLIVQVDETKLDGAAETLVVPVVHSFLMSDAKVQVATARFLSGEKMAQ